jgi:predicted RNase H-like HicB family nuclease
MITYLATIHKENNSDYGAQFYDFLGCITAGETIEELKIMATEALNSHIALMLADGEEIPPSTPLEIILKDRDHQDALAFMMIAVAEEILSQKQLCLQMV